MRVSVVETLGHEKDVYLQTRGGVQVIARVPATEGVEEGSDVEVFFDADRVHLFETGENGVNVGLNGHGARTSAA